MAIAGSRTIAGVRGCGTRQTGGVYFECGLGDEGLPIEMFLRDRPVPIDKEREGLSDRGVKLIKDSRGTWHVIDIVGESHYPDVVRFIEETRRMGLSRRAANNLPFGLLTPDRIDPQTGDLIPGSRIMLAHRRAGIGFYSGYYAAREQPRYGWRDRPDGYCWEWCPLDAQLDPMHRFNQYEIVRRRRPHDISGMDAHGVAGMCAGLYWEDIADADDTSNDAATMGKRDRIVHVGGAHGYTFAAQVRPSGIVSPYHMAIFLSMPITNLVVVDGPGADVSEKRLRDQGMVVLDDNDAEGADDLESDGAIPVFRVKH